MQIRTLVLRDPKEVPGSLPPLSRHKSERLATRYYLEFTSRSGKPWFQAPKREKKMGMFGRPRLGRNSKAYLHHLLFPKPTSFEYQEYDSQVSS